MLQFVDVEDVGWHYAGELPWATASLAVTADISSSPPGLAKINPTLTMSPSDLQAVYEFQNNDPGRPNGPALHIYPEGLWFPIPDSTFAPFVRLEQADYQSEFGPCRLGHPDYYEQYLPDNDGVYCSLQPTSNPAESGDVPQDQVTALGEALQGVSPTYIFGDTSSTGCDTYVSPQGTITGFAKPLPDASSAPPPDPSASSSGTVCGTHLYVGVAS